METKNKKMNLQILYLSPFTTDDVGLEVHDKDGMFVLETDNPYIADKIADLLNIEASKNGGSIAISFDNYADVPLEMLHNNYLRMSVGTIGG